MREVVDKRHMWRTNLLLHVAITDRRQVIIFKQDIEGAWWLEIITVCSENPHCGCVPTSKLSPDANFDNQKPCALVIS